MSDCAMPGPDVPIIRTGDTVNITRDGETVAYNVVKGAHPDTIYIHPLAGQKLELRRLRWSPDSPPVPEEEQQ